MNNNATTTSLALLQVTLNAVFLIYISIKFDISPEQIVERVETKVQRAELQLDSIESKITANKVWIEEATKSLGSIDVELQKRGDWMKDVETKLDTFSDNSTKQEEIESLFKKLFINNPGIKK